jgi:hypothetical protein
MRFLFPVLTVNWGKLAPQDVCQQVEYERCHLQLAAARSVHDWWHVSGEASIVIAQRWLPTMAPTSARH